MSVEFPTTGISALLLQSLVIVSTPTPPPNKQMKKHYRANGHFFLLWLTTNHLISPPPPSPLHLSIPQFLSPHLIHTCPPSTSLFECLFLLFRYKSKWPPPCHGYSAGQSCAGWNLMPTCAPRHAFHTTNGSLLSVCLHCWAKLSPLTPMNH